MFELLWITFGTVYLIIWIGVMIVMSRDWIKVVLTYLDKRRKGND